VSGIHQGDVAYDEDLVKERHQIPQQGIGK